MRNIFLTGEVGIGKSTVIRKVLSMLPDASCGGFRTVSLAPITEGSVLDVFIERAWEQTPHDVAHRAGSRFGHGRFSPYPEVFDTVGTSILSSPPAAAMLILMDELGMMENDAFLFRRAVLEALDGPLPVLGVIKPRHSDFLDTIRAHDNCTVFEVTKDNRDCLPSSLVELLHI